MTQNLPSYYQAAHFISEAAAGKAYTPLQILIYDKKNDCDLSAYRFKITSGWYVVILGKKPNEALRAQIEALLRKGTLVTLERRPDVLAYLQRRRERASQIAPWVELHYRHREEHDREDT